MVKKAKIAAPTLKMISFASSDAFEAWLAKHHETSPGIWLQFYKKHTGKPTISRSEAIDVALCYGWIDSQLAPHDADSWLHKFSPRKSKSLWSNRNREQVTMLIKTGRLRPAGLAHVTSAQADGRWDRAYDKPSEMTVPADFLKELKKDKKAYAFFQTLNKANTYAIAWRLQTAKKPETRQKRFDVLLEMLKEGKKLH